MEPNDKPQPSIKDLLMDDSCRGELSIPERGRLLWRSRTDDLFGLAHPETGIGVSEDMPPGTQSAQR